LNGAGIAFFGSYVFHLFLTYPMARWLSGFGWSKENTQKVLIFLSLIGLVFAGFYWLPYLWAGVFGIAATIASSIYSIRILIRLVPLDRLPLSIRRLLLSPCSSALNFNASSTADDVAVIRELK
jgi:PST family polysaccharide transporter